MVGTSPSLSRLPTVVTLDDEEERENVEVDDVDAIIVEKSECNCVSGCGKGQNIVVLSEGRGAR